MLSRNPLASCRLSTNVSLHVFHRTLATETVTELSSSSIPVPSIRTKRPPRAHISAAVILNRSPIVTRTPTLFERAYYAYQARIRRSLHNPFPFDFYFKQGSLLETRFNMEEKKRERRAFGPNFGRDDEFVSKEKAAADKAAADQLALQEGEVEDFMPRVHTADTIRDLHSLDRKGKRNIYLLLLTNAQGKVMWRFPQGDVEKGELLHQAAQRDLHAECGSFMDTWIVSRNPIGVYKPAPLESLSEEAEKITFFFKAHIMAGQVKLDGTSIKDFAWLTKQEIEARVQKDYWDGVKDVLSDY
ncbi:39S mitochondrial ribosomal protein L46-domain-containing protein [Collybia nuda]|uniref:Large ribosomal subunit protein mL46 n=1 Tax=Collybia nuda TaxID=64659 RepID=A0A9P5Y166_9AGAR|nr:39S mitochondrial ribosomal protein L46-domain-containing protein [Collybia nuda]